MSTLHSIPESWTSKMTLENVVGALVSTERWGKDLAFVPYRYFKTGISIVFYIRMNETDSGVEYMLITHKILELMDVSEDDLYSAALQNIGKPYIANIYEFSLNEEANDLDDGLYILTTQNRIFGAFLMASTDVLDSIVTRVGGSFYILPGSINEVYILDSTKCVGHSDFERIIDAADEVTRTLTNPGDYLTDHVYFYDHNLKALINVGNKKNMGLLQWM